MTAKVRGADRLSATLSAASRNLADMPASVHQQAGDIVARAAAGRAPSRTGRLHSSIRTATTGRGAAVTAGVRYARFPEYGTRYVRAYRFLSGALDDNTDAVLDVYDREVNRQLDRVKGD